MSRGTFVLRDGILVRKEDAAPLVTRKPSDLACPMILSDAMAPTQSMADGSWHESKSGIRATYRNGPVKYVEVGNDPGRLQTAPKPKPDRAAIAATVDRAVARFERGERA